MHAGFSAAGNQYGTMWMVWQQYKEVMNAIRANGE